jgi:dihydroorotate dehydrogenase (NAD+) catalytic subunit
MLNSIGLQNPGTKAVIDGIMPSLKKNETKFIINISGSSVEEYGEIAKHFDDTDIDAVEINISCPNVKEGGVAFGNDPEMSFRVVEICRKNTTKPIITKLSPNQTDIAKNAARCIDAGSDGLAVINTVTGMAVDIETRKPVIGNNRGGLSGPSIKPIALLRVHQVYQVSKKHSIPIIGQGGITSANDALEFIIAGAATIGVGTALFYDPLVCEKINTGISQYLSDQKLSNVGSLVGTLQLN